MRWATEWRCQCDFCGKRATVTAANDLPNGWRAAWLSDDRESVSFDPGEANHFTRIDLCSPCVRSVGGEQ